MTSLFGNPPVFQNYDAVCHADGRESVRNEKRHLPRREFCKALKYFELAARVQRRGGLVQNQKLRISQISAGQRNFQLRTPDGTVNWTEAAVGRPPVLSQAELLALQMERQLC